MLISIPLKAAASEDIDLHRECRHCGMDRKLYGYSRMMVEYDDGTTVGTCSLHCFVTERKENPGKGVRKIFVADRNSRTLIDAQRAFWVIGGTKRGVMTMRAKWAFGRKEDALSFIAAYGGTLATWKDALDAAEQDHQPHTRTR